MSDELPIPSFLRPEGRRRICMFSIMMERGRRAEEFRALGVQAVFQRLGHGRYPDSEADMMRGWLAHMAQTDVSMDVSERIAEIEAQYARGRRYYQWGRRAAQIVRIGLPLILLAVIATVALMLVPDISAAV